MMQLLTGPVPSGVQAAFQQGYSVICAIRDALFAVVRSTNISNRNFSGDVTSGDDYTPVLLPISSRKLDLILWDNPLIIRRRTDPAAQWDEPIYLNAPGTYSLTAWTAQFEHRNYTAGSDAHFSYTAWD